MGSGMQGTMQGTINGPFGPKAQTYVDFAASGRPLPQVEQFMQQNVHPYYANTHTETADCGRYMSSLYEQARHTIAKELQADLSQYAVIFTGSGCTGALDKLARALLGGADSKQGHNWLPWRQSALLPVVFIGPHEHHSNEVLWREQRCVVVTIPETPDGHICQAALARQLQAYAHHPLRLGSFSAGSNVTGITQDVDALASLLHSHGALACFDYAGAGPYVSCSLAAPAGQPLAYKDAVTLSPHKLLGGPGACGLLVARRELFGAVPTVPGGGTVLFVGPSRHEYLHSVEEREEAGTPNILGALRCGLAFSLRSTLGAATIQRLSSSAIHALIASLQTNANIVLLGSSAAAYHSSSRLPIISMLFKAPSHGPAPSPSSASSGAGSASKLQQGMLLHHGFVCKLLNDMYGIQARSGCSCAGPYGHLLLDVCEQVSRQQQELAMAGEACIKAGWVRVSLSFTTEPVDVQYVAAALHQVAEHGWQLLPQYVMDVGSGAWQHASMAGQPLQQAYPSCNLKLPTGSSTAATSPSSTPAAAPPPPPAAPSSEPEGAEPLDIWAAGAAAASKAMARFATAQAECYSLLQEHVWQPAEAALGQPAKLPAAQRAAVYRRQLQQAAQLYERAGEWVEQQRGGAHGSSSSSSGGSMSAALQRHRWWLMPEEAASLLQSNAVQPATSRQKPQHEAVPAAPAATAAEGGGLKLASGLAKAAALASSKALVVAEAVTCDSPSGPTTPARVSADDVANHFRSRCSSSTLLVTRLAGSSISNMAASSGSSKRSSTDGGEGGGAGTIAPQSGSSDATAAAVLSASALMGLQAGQSLVLRCWAGAVRLEGSGAQGLRLQLLQGQ